MTNATATRNTLTGERRTQTFRTGLAQFLKVTYVTGCSEAIEARAWGTEMVAVYHGALTFRAERVNGASYGWTANLSAGNDILEHNALENFIGNPSEALTRGEITNFLRESMAQIIDLGGCACGAN